MNIGLKSKKHQSKPAIRLGRSRQVVIPKKMSDNLGLVPGDYIELTQHGKMIVLTPRQAEVKKTRFDRDFEEALEDVRRGRMSGPFDTAGQLKRHLQSVTK